MLIIPDVSSWLPQQEPFAFCIAKVHTELWAVLWDLSKAGISPSFLLFLLFALLAVGLRGIPDSL